MCENANKKLAEQQGKAFKKSVKNGDVVIFTLETHHKSDKDNVEHSVFPEHCLNGSDGWQMMPHLQVVFQKLKEKDLDRVFIIEKKTFGSFELIPVIRAFMKDNKDLEIELCGMPTDTSVLHNAIILYNAIPTAKFSIDSSCCAGTTAEKHDTALKMLKDIGFEIK
jgi:nicotinamidase-related amidase